MNKPRYIIVAAFVVGSVFGLTRLGDAVAIQPTAAPDSIDVTVGQVEISKDDVDDYLPLFTAATMRTLDASSNQELGRGDVPVGAYRALRVTLSGMLWNVSMYTAANRSPCTGDSGGADNGPVDLGGHSIFYFKTPDLGGNTLAYYRANPPLTGYVGDADHPFVLASPVTVVKGLPTTVNLTLDVDHTLACNSVSLFTLAGGGPVATIAGSKTGLTDAAGAVLDPYAEQVGVTNRGNNSVTFYDQFDDVYPVRTLIGPATLLNEPIGIALWMNQADHTKDELFVANRGNNSISVFNRSSSGNSAPLRSISGLFTKLNLPEGVAVDAAHSELVAANSGNDSVTFYDRAASEDALPLHTIIGSQTGLSQPSGVALRPDPVDSTKDAIVVANHGNDTVTIYDRNGLLMTFGRLTGGSGAATGVSNGSSLKLALNGDITRSISFTSTVTTGVDVATQIQNRVRALASIVPSQLQSAYLQFTASFDSSTTSYTLTSGAPGSNSSVVVIGGVTEPNATALKLIQSQGAIQFDGTNVLPVKTLTSATLDGPTGVAVYLDPNNHANDEIIVANEGSSPGTGSISIYDWDTVMSSTGDVSPVTTILGLNTPNGLYLDTAQNQMGVVQAGDQVAMAFQPSIVPAGSMAGSGSALTGDYNVVIYGVDLKAVNRRGYVTPVVISERGAANFDGSGGFSLKLDTQIGRQILEVDCLAGSDVGITTTGYYGANNDGSFYALLPGTGGSFQGAFLPDGSVFVGSIYDSSDHLRLIYGVRATIFAPYLTSDGTSTGLAAHYGFTSYRDDLFNVGRFDDDPKTHDTLQYMLGIGMAKTDSASFLGVSSDANAVTVSNPMGDTNDPGGGAIYRTGFSPLEKPVQLYDNSNPGGGLIDNHADGLTGALTADGASLIFARDTTTKDSNACPTDIGFGIGLRQRPAGTFHANSLKGTYFVAAFGDQFDENAQRSQHRVTALSLTFDGRGHAQMAEIDNQEGMISVDQVLFTYQVKSKAVPVDGGTIFKVDVVDLFSRDLVGPYASALISENGRSLIFFRSLNLVHTPNLTRLLGLALFQHS
jgi:hypothetical protein